MKLQNFFKGTYVVREGLSPEQALMIADAMVYDGANLFHDTSMVNNPEVVLFGVDLEGDFVVASNVGYFGEESQLTELDHDSALLNVRHVDRPSVTRETSAELADFLYNSKLGQTKTVAGVAYVRVPGGWLINGSFVPRNDEFADMAPAPQVGFMQVINGKKSDVLSM